MRTWKGPEILFYKICVTEQRKGTKHSIRLSISVILPAPTKYYSILLKILSSIASILKFFVLMVILLTQEQAEVGANVQCMCNSSWDLFRADWRSQLVVLVLAFMCASAQFIYANDHLHSLYGSRLKDFANVTFTEPKKKNQRELQNNIKSFSLTVSMVLYFYHRQITNGRVTSFVILHMRYVANAILSACVKQVVSHTAVV